MKTSINLQRELPKSP